MDNKIKYLLGLCVMGVLTLGSSAGFAVTACPDPSATGPTNGCSLPGTDVVDGSYPYFMQSAYVTLKNKKNGDFYLNASYGGIASDVSRFYVDGDTAYDIDNTFFRQIVVCRSLTKGAPQEQLDFNLAIGDFFDLFGPWFDDGSGDHLHRRKRTGQLQFIGLCHDTGCNKRT